MEAAVIISQIGTLSWTWSGPRRRDDMRYDVVYFSISVLL